MKDFDNIFTFRQRNLNKLGQYKLILIFNKLFFNVCEQVFTNFDLRS